MSAAKNVVKNQVRNVYFFCLPTGSPENALYQHNTIALAEGLQILGIQTFCNIDYWENEKGYLLKKSNVNFQTCDVVYFDAVFYNKGLAHLLPSNLFSTERKYKLVFNDSSDGLITPGFLPEIQQVDVVLKSHYNTNYNYPKNFVPWQFGITNRIVQSVNPSPFYLRERQFLNNFRVEHPLRTMAQKKVAPIMKKLLIENCDTDSLDDIRQMSGIDLGYWHQTGRRHYPNYYNRLSNSFACFCFGGSPQKIISSRKGLPWEFLLKADRHLLLFKYDRVFQYDSWRFWEALVAGCCTIHIDLTKYGCKLPVMPVNGVHYLGFDLNNIDKIKKVINNNPEMFSNIGNAGRQWVLENYSPKAIATRLLNLISF